MLDEAYEGMTVEPSAHILMKSDFPKTNAAAAWTWSYQGKRGFIFSPATARSGCRRIMGPRPTRVSPSDN